MSGVSHPSAPPSSLLNNKDAERNFEGSLCLETLGIFPESEILTLPTNTPTRSQIPGTAGDRVDARTPGSLHAVQNHPDHHFKALESLQASNTCLLWFLRLLS